MRHVSGFFMQKRRLQKTEAGMFDYIYGDEGEQFSFYRIPKLLFTSDVFNRMSAESKILYGIMLDRVTVSLKNNWIDEAGRVYIICTVEEIMESLNCGNKKACQLMAELENDTGLIERRRRGLGKPNLIYVKNFLYVVDNSGERHFLKCQNDTSGSVKTTSLEVSKRHVNNINMSNTDMNETNYHIVSSGNGERKRDLSVREQTESYFRETLAIDQMKEVYPYDKDVLEGMVAILVDTCCTAKDTIRIGGEDKPAAVVKSRLMKLNLTHIQYVMDTLSNCCGDIRNMKQYILTLLYNAPTTIDAYYRAMVNRDYNSDGGNSS